ncbi:MAG: hypothetical protein IT385_18675 [Deltaproteobacteria bacterium]|nr:hypothetical protein [Deltaproteobacteria bacterium]
MRGTNAENRAMMTVRVSAPGKLMLAGEYVVVERGTPALSVAVEHRVTLEATVREAPGWSVTSEALGFVEEPLYRVPVLAEALARVPGAPRGGHVLVRSALGAGPEKPGLGSSAAVCVAGFAAFTRLLGTGAEPSLLTIIEAHRAAQGGMGSGYDVATALHGGLIVFEPAAPGAAPKVEPLAWPTGLVAAVFKAHRGASTIDMLRRVAAWRDEDPETLDACLEPLAIETEELVAAFRKGDVERVLTAAAQVQEELGVMDRMGDLGILSGGQIQLHGVIEDSGCVGRTSGAGGGDCVWALADDPEAITRAMSSARELGFTCLDLRFPAAGLRIGEDV